MTLNPEVFLREQMGNVDMGTVKIPFTIQATFLGDIILYVNSPYDGHHGDCSVTISPSIGNVAATRCQGSQGFANFEESMRVAKHIQLAASIAQKWQATVQEQTTRDESQRRLNALLAPSNQCEWCGQYQSSTLIEYGKYNYCNACVVEARE